MTPPITSAENYGWLLQQLVQAIPGARSAVLSSSDGINKYFHGISQDTADTLAPMATSMVSLPRNAGKLVGSRGHVRYIMAMLDDLVFFMCTAGENSVLAVLAEPDVDPGLLTHKMHELAQKVPDQLTTPTRAVSGARR
jgi:predicted regulator of Ras-like GTPase activity (Roadblock/LC7/MglB family)